MGNVGREEELYVEEGAREGMFFWYHFRRWLARKLVPKNLTVFCFDGMEDVGGSNAYDPKTDMGWFEVKLQYWDMEVTGSPESGKLVFHCRKRLESEDALNRQNSDR